MNCRYFFIGLSLLTPILLTPLTSHAHTDTRKSEQNFIAAAASITYRSDVPVDNRSPWLIPGALLGGEALPPQQGFALDYARLNGQWLGQGYRVHGALAAHSFSGEIKPELEHLWLQGEPALGPAKAELAAGRMATRTTPIANWHATDSPFSEMPLLAAAFWGGHFADTGARAGVSWGALQAGLEAWNGDNWPASSGEGSADVYLQWQPVFGPWQASIGAWAMQSKAANRADSRYSASHSHGGQTIVNSAGDYRFSGDVESLGGYGSVALQTRFGQVAAHLEWQQQTSDGNLTDLSQNSDWRGEYNGVYGGLSLTTSRHTIALRHERLVLENTFYGNVSTLFIENAGLVNNGFEPGKSILSWLYQWQPGLDIRLEAVDDRSVEDAAKARFNVGLRWQMQMNARRH